MGCVAVQCHLGGDWFAHTSAILVRIIRDALVAPNNPKALQDQICSHIAVGGVFLDTDAAFRRRLSVTDDLGPALHGGEFSHDDLGGRVCLDLHAVVVVWSDQALPADATCCLGGLFDDCSCRDLGSTVFVRDSIRNLVKEQLTYGGDACVL